MSATGYVYKSKKRILQPDIRLDKNW